MCGFKCRPDIRCVCLMMSRRGRGNKGRPHKRHRTTVILLKDEREPMESERGCVNDLCDVHVLDPGVGVHSHYTRKLSGTRQETQSHHAPTVPASAPLCSFHFMLFH